MAKKHFTSRRGVALEYAIIIMLVIMGLSTIILTNTMLQASHRNRMEANFYAEMDLDSIGASFISELGHTNPTFDDEWKAQWPNHNIEVVSETGKHTLTVRQNDEKLLYIEAKKLGLTVTVEKWERYS